MPCITGVSPINQRGLQAIMRAGAERLHECSGSCMFLFFGEGFAKEVLPVCSTSREPTTGRLKSAQFAR